MIGLNSGRVVVELAAAATQAVRTRRDGSLLRAIESIVPINRDCRIQMGLEKHFLEICRWVRQRARNADHLEHVCLYTSLQASPEAYPILNWVYAEISSSVQMDVPENVRLIPLLTQRTMRSETAGRSGIVDRRETRLARQLSWPSNHVF
jgi:hypothetical protein